MPTQQGAAEHPVTWRADGSARDESAEPETGLLTMVRRGMGNHCPNCGQGRVFDGFLRVVPECPACHAPLGLLRADDAPPYIVIFLVGHLLIPPIFWIEKAYEPPMWLHMVVWLPLFALLCTLLLRPVKGGVVGWMWRLGFGASDHPHHGAPHGVPATPPETRPGRDRDV